MTGSSRARTGSARRGRSRDTGLLNLPTRVRARVESAPVQPDELATALRVIEALFDGDPGEVRRFFETVDRQLDRDSKADPLERLMLLFDLSKSELAALFGVRRQAIDGWLASGVPAARQEKLSALSALADLLERKLKRDRIPGVARRAADAYGGLTMLEMVEADRHRELLTSARDAFDWSSVA